MHTVNYTIKTEGEMKIHSATWSVPIMKDITTREFRTSNSKNNQDIFQLKMQFINNSNVTMEIYYLSPKPVFLKLILKRWQSQREQQIIANKDYHKTDANKWQNLISLPNSMNEYSYNLIFEFTFFDHIKAPETELTNDFQNLLIKRLFSDVTVKSDEGTEYKVHKAVLASRSPVLDAHFKHNTTEHVTNILESPLESEVLNEVLTFIYSDQVPKIDEIPDKLLVAADYYQLNKLKGLCEKALRKKLTIENAVEILQLAYFHSADTLLEHTLQFIKDGNAKAITKTEEWAKISSVDLIKIMYEYNADNDVVYIDVNHQ